MDIVLFLMLLLQGIFMLVISVLGLISIYFMINSGFMRTPPPVPSSGKIKTTMLQDVEKILSKRKNQVVMDLGSGWGTLLLPLAKKFPQHRFIGVEHGFLPCWISKLRARKMNNITFLRQDFFNTDISKADVIFLFLMTKLMNKIAAKCQSETRKGTLIYANRFPMKSIKPERKVSLGSKFYTYYVYKM